MKREEKTEEDGKGRDLISLWMPIPAPTPRNAGCPERLPQVMEHGGTERWMRRRGDAKGRDQTTRPGYSRRAQCGLLYHHHLRSWTFRCKSRIDAPPSNTVSCFTTPPTHGEDISRNANVTWGAAICGLKEQRASTPSRNAKWPPCQRIFGDRHED